MRKWSNQKKIPTSKTEMGKTNQQPCTYTKNTHRKSSEQSPSTGGRLATQAQQNIRKRTQDANSTDIQHKSIKQPEASRKLHTGTISNTKPPAVIAINHMSNERLNKNATYTFTGQQTDHSLITCCPV